MRCDELSDDLAAAAEGSALLGRNERRHVERCLRCQAELVQYRRLLRTMRAMRTEVLEPAPGVLAEILANLEAAGERHADPLDDLRATGRRTSAACAAATAAGAAGAIVFAPGPGGSGGPLSLTGSPIGRWTGAGPRLARVADCFAGGSAPVGQ